MSGPQRHPKVKVRRTIYRRLVYRRQFYLPLVKIVAEKLMRGASRDAVFVARMGLIGDLVYVFPMIERLAERYSVEVATGPDPYRLFVRSNPHVHRTYSPFLYKSKHVWIIRRVLEPLYQRVILLDVLGEDWWKRGKHISELFAEECGFPPPDSGIVYLSEKNRKDAERYLERKRLTDCIYVAQVIRHARPYRSSPLSHYHELYRMLKDRSPQPILVDTTGSDETDIPTFCRRLECTES